jgi:hypothetical protein
METPLIGKKGVTIHAILVNHNMRTGRCFLRVTRATASSMPDVAASRNLPTK